MMTTKIEIKNYLVEYCLAKYPADIEGVVKFPSNSMITWQIYLLLAKRPENITFDKGNLEFVIPYKREKAQGIYKNIESYNYITEKGAKTLRRFLFNEFWCEVHLFLDTEKLRHGIDYQDSADLFLSQYKIKQLTSDAIIKSHYRYRDRKKKYKKQKKQEYICCN